MNSSGCHFPAMPCRSRSGQRRRQAWPRLRVWWWAAWLAGGAALAAAILPPGTGGAATLSASGQFVVHSTHTTPPPLRPAARAGDTKLVPLEADTLTVTCERVKARTLRELGLPDRWQGRLHLWLSPVLTPDSVLSVRATRFANGWQYDLELPEYIEPSALVRLVVQGLLMELANRTPGPNSPEMPIWLIEGLTGTLMASVGPDLVALENARVGQLGRLWQLQSSTRSQQPAELYRQLRAQLRDRQPLTFNDLSLPNQAQLQGPNLEHYRACAELFLIELLRLPQGPAALDRMIGRLTQHLNWQTAFLEGFRPYFARLLDVEKWWALGVAQFTGRQAVHAWPREVSMQTLEQLLRVDVQVRGRPTELPRHTTVPLREVIARWDWPRQSWALGTKINQLLALEANVPPELVPLVRGYLGALQNYSILRSRLGVVSPNHRGQVVSEAGLLVRDVLRRLEELDRQRATLAGSAGADSASTPANVSATAQPGPRAR